MVILLSITVFLWSSVIFDLLMTILQFTNSSHGYLTNSQTIRVRLLEEQPRGTVIEDIAKYLRTSILGSNESLSEFTIIANNPVINNILHIDKPQGRLITQRPIDRDRLCEHDGLCCEQSSTMIQSREKITNDPYFVDTHRTVRTFSSHSRRTSDDCHLIFRVLYKVVTVDDSTKNSLIIDQNGELNFCNIALELIDINDNRPEFILPSQKETEIKILATGSVPVIELSINEATSVGSCLRLPSIRDSDSSMYGIDKYQLSKVSLSEIQLLNRKLGLNMDVTEDAYSSIPFNVVANECGSSTIWTHLDKFDVNQGHPKEGFLSPFLKLITNLDRESKDEYWFSFIAIDGNSIDNVSGRNSKHNVRHTSTMYVHVKVEDANDNQPKVPTELNLHVREDAAVGTVMYTMSGSDEDIGMNARLMYHIDGNKNQLANFPFHIDPMTGILTVKSKLDADRPMVDNKKEIQFKIITHDSGHPKSNSATTQVSILLIEVNDETPEIKVVDLLSRSKPPQPTVRENLPPGQLIVFVTATDADVGLHGSINCEVDNTKFRLDNIISSVESLHSNFDRSQPFPMKNNLKEYKLLTTQSLDRETRPIEEVTISCTDQTLSTSDIRTGEQKFFVTILDENDNEPVFDALEYHLQIAENLPINEFIVNFNATDSDVMYTRDDVHNSWNKPNLNKGHNLFSELSKPFHTPITYSLDEQGLKYFHLDRLTGALYVRHSLDREIMSNIQFVVTATDGGIPPRNASVEVYVSVLDVNDNIPQFKQKVYDVEVLENCSMNTQILNISASDPDEGMNGQVKYRMEDVHGIAQKYFRFDETKGTLILRKSLDRETQDWYTFKIYAFDQGLPKQSSHTTVNIHVLDVNDNAPKFVYPTKKNHTILASVYTKPGLPLVKLTAADPDQGLNARMTFSIDGQYANSDIFSLDGISGELSLFGSRDPESLEGEYELNLRVQDTGTPPLFGTANVRIILNRNIPPLSLYPGASGSYLQTSNIDQDSSVFPNQQPKGKWKINPVQSTWNDKKGENANTALLTGVSYTSERIMIVVICLIAISALFAFIFLLVITLIRRKAIRTDNRRVSASRSSVTNVRNIRRYAGKSSAEFLANGDDEQKGTNSPRKMECAHLYGAKPYSTLQIIPGHLNDRQKLVPVYHTLTNGINMHCKHLSEMCDNVPEEHKQNSNEDEQYLSQNLTHCPIWLPSTRLSPTNSSTHAQVTYMCKRDWSPKQHCTQSHYTELVNKQQQNDRQNSNLSTFQTKGSITPNLTRKKNTDPMVEIAEAYGQWQPYTSNMQTSLNNETNQEKASLSLLDIKQDLKLSQN